MIKHTDPYEVSQIFSNDKSVFYYIPKYQREYTWGKREWGLLFNDVIENDKGYFLGSIICVDDSQSALGETVLEVIDGQQRITSLSILLLALYEQLNARKEFLDDDQKIDLSMLKRELVIKKGSQFVARLTPQVQSCNQADYYSLLADSQLINAEKSKYAGIRRIYKAFDYFNECIEKYITETIGDKEYETEEKKQKEVEALFDLVDKFNSSVLVAIQVETHKDAYMLFESLNNRGVPLSAIDLIKNLLISVSDKDQKADECYLKWKNILGYLGEEYGAQERFFRYYYDVYREELNKPYPVSGNQKYALGYVATRSNLMEIYEKLIKADYSTFLVSVEREAKTYSVLINNANEDDSIPELSEELLNLERIQGAPGYILLMYLLSNKNSLEITNEIIKSVIKYLISFFVRRNITDYPNTRNLVKIFMDTVDIAKANRGGTIYTKIVEYLRTCSSTDEMFMMKLGGPIYLDNPDAARFLLCYYEDQFKTNEIYTDLWKRDDSNKYVWTIEHIFPEGENIPECWVDMIADGNKELATNYLNQYAHTLGNLTITGYNSSLSNYAFDKKKDRKNKDGNYVGYRNGLKLNENVVNQEKWTVENIKARTDMLVAYVMDRFKL